jgi:hypothetical protein
MPRRMRLLLSVTSLWLLTSCTPKPPDVPVCKALKQHITTDPDTKHTLLTPSPACITNLGEAECGYCVWIVSGQARFIGEKKQLVPLQQLVEGQQKGEYTWEVVKGKDGKPVLVSSWLNEKPWSQIVSESAFLPAEESYAPLSAYVINSCKKMNCDDKVTPFKVKLDSLNGIPGAIKN